MVEFENNYELMASSLQVMNKRLYLLNPKYLADQRVNEAKNPDGQELGETAPQDGTQQHQEIEGEDDDEEEQQDEYINEEEKNDPRIDEEANEKNEDNDDD